MRPGKRGSVNGTESEKDLNGPDFGSTAAIGVATAALAQSAKGGARWLRWFVMACVGVAALAVGAGTVDKLVNIGTLPACDEQRTRDTLSDLNKANKVNASAYNFIRPVSATDTEVRCVANLALLDGGTLEYDYRVHKDGSGLKVEITEYRRP
jgi:hypothetical protein